jgi:hypothetical protein
VTSIVARTWSKRLVAGIPSPPQKFAAKEVPVERNRKDQDEQQDRHDLGDGDDLVDRRRLLHPAQYREVKRPDADRRDEYRGERVAVAEDRKKGA